MDISETIPSDIVMRFCKI